MEGHVVVQGLDCFARDIAQYFKDRYEHHKLLTYLAFHIYPLCDDVKLGFVVVSRRVVSGVVLRFISVPLS